MRRYAFALILFLSVLMLAGVAQAHVVVTPKESKAGGYERYTIRVPTEKAIPTVKLRVELPPGSTFSSVLPIPGWAFATEKDASGHVTALIWSGGQINAGEFQEFGVSVRNAKEPGDAVWKAHQIYSDGSTVDWTAGPGAGQPAPVVKLTPASQAPASPAEPSPPAARPEATSGTPGPGAAGVWMGGGALVISLAALLVAFWRKS